MPAVRFSTTTFAELRRRLDGSVIYDWTMRFPVIAYCSFMLSRDIFAFYQQVLHDPTALEQFDSGVVIAMLARISQWMFIILLSIQPLFRLRAIGKSEEILPRVVAMLAMCIPLAFLELERAPPSISFNLAAIILSLVANVMCLVTVSFLGRSLSVMPEARRLVRSGPYGIVRHPLYPCEILATGAVVLQYRSLPAVGLLLLLIVLQVMRAQGEEKVLARAFPGFAAYRAQTSFMIPRDPVHFLASFLLEPAMRWRSAVIVASMVVVSTLVVTVLPRLVA